MKVNPQRAIKAVCIFLVVVMLFLFFSNDFGLVDIHKSSVVMAVGIDVEGEEYQVTAQAAVPTPASGEGSAAYTQVTGTGATVAEAINDINVQTGFYPKLMFCELVILGDSCQNGNIFSILDYFYRNDYVPLTALVGMCQGSAKELLEQKPAGGDMSSMAINRAMSDELKKSANVAAVNLKELAQNGASKSRASYMPYIICEQSGSGGTTSAAAQEGKSEESGGEQSAQFTCRQTCVFSEGSFGGLLDEEQTFAFNLLRGGVRLAVVNAAYQGVNYTAGLKNNSCKLRLAVKDGAPVLKVKIKAVANVQAAESTPALESNADTLVIKQGVLQAVEEEVKERVTSLFTSLKNYGCDAVGAKQMLYAYKNKYYNRFKDSLQDVLKADIQVSIKSKS